MQGFKFYDKMIRMWKNKVLVELENSLAELEKAVSMARDSLRAQKDIPEWVFNRLEQYMKLIEKQKSLARQLSKESSFEEINTIAEKINILSSMIADDSTELVATLFDPGAKIEKKNYISC